jgi:transposase
MRRRAEIVERSFAHNLDRGGMRRTWLRGRENVHKRYLVHIAGHNLGILMRLLIGAGTPREAAARAPAYLFFVYTEDVLAIILVAASRDGFAILGVAVASGPARPKQNFSNGLIRPSFTGLNCYRRAPSFLALTHP